MLYLMNHSEALDTVGAQGIFAGPPADVPTDERVMRTALEMARDRGLSQREIARELNLPLATIKMHLQAAVREMRAAVLAESREGRAEWSMAA